jgi:hypothetical protein
MRPELVERYYLLPTLDALFSSIGVKRKLGLSHFVRYLKKVYASFELEKDGLAGTLRKNGETDIVGFTLGTCGHLVGWKGYGDHDDLKAAWMAHWNLDEKVPTSKWTTRTPFIKELAAYGGYFGIQTLTKLLECRNALVERSRTCEASLDEILSLN